MTPYNKIGHLYDLLYRFKDYDKEAHYVRERIRTSMPQARTMLDVACGTGNHIVGLQDDFDIEGLDLSAEMLAQARLKFPQRRFHQASMVDFDLGRRYDVVCCLFRSIGFVRTPQGLRSAVGAMARHLVPGGMLLIDPFFTPEAFWVGKVTQHEVRSESMAVSWMYVSDRQGDVGIFRNHYLLGRPEGIEHIVEDHELGLFRPEHFRQAFAEAGLSLEHDPQGPSGLGFYVGRLPAEATPN
jgi:ubiquinone/menaquinone biosynthesis C-methylase UbiE